MIQDRFLLVSLNIDAVLQEITVRQRKRKLDEMIQGNGLRDAYSATLVRIKAQKGGMSRLGMEALMWLSHSKRPLNVHELCDALGVEIGSTDLDPQNIPAIETLLGCTLGLATLEESSHIVRLVHYTLQEYLSENYDLFQSPHSAIAEVCLTYLNFQCIRDLSLTDDWLRQPTPLLEYASCYWGAHTSGGITASVNTLALRLLDRFDKHVSSVILLTRSGDNRGRVLGPSNPAGFTGLHGCAYLGITEIAVCLLNMKEWDLGATDVARNTAILWAAKRGHGAIVKTFLERVGITPNDTDQTGRTPLSWVAGNGYQGVVKILLGHGDVTPNTADEGGRTPLLWAAINGYGGIVEMLLERLGVTRNTADQTGRTPLSWAAGNGCESVVKILLEKGDVTPNTTDESGRAPLSWAAGNGHGGSGDRGCNSRYSGSRRSNTSLVGSREWECGGPGNSFGTGGCKPQHCG